MKAIKYNVRISTDNMSTVNYMELFKPSIPNPKITSYLLAQSTGVYDIKTNSQV